ncbi:RNA repair, ligase-Pnkp-associating, region of Hen1 [compost metagenome]
MHIRFQAKGENVEKISYFLGKNPINPYIKETKYGTIEVKFIEYKSNFVDVYIVFRSKGLEMVKESEFKGLEHYINDREFSISTIFLSNVKNSIGHVLSYDYDEIDTNFDFSLTLGPISTKLPNEAILELFEPLGYDTEIKEIQLDYDFKIESSGVYEITLNKTCNIVSLFRHIYVLIPVIDNYKHHFISKDEVDKLLRLGDGWLATHPKNEFISKRYVGYRESLFKTVITSLENEKEVEESKIEEQKEEKVGLGKLRYLEFAKQVENLGVTEVVDMGAGEGRLIELLAKNKNLNQLIACEPTLTGRQRMYARIDKLDRKKLLSIKPQVIQSSLFYKDYRLVNKECIVLCEVIEHINADRIDNVMDIILNYNKPKHFIISTPNFEYNVLYETMKTKFRHGDHRFEMTRKEFKEFIDKHAERCGYDVEYVGIGESHEQYGYATQMAVMKRKDEK